MKSGVLGESTSLSTLILVFIKLQNCHKGLGRNGNGTEGAHTLLAFLLLLQQLLLTGDVAAVALGQHVLADSLDGFAGDDLAADGSLDGDFKLGTGDVLLQLFADLTGPGIGIVRKEDEAQGEIGRASCRERV